MFKFSFSRKGQSLIVQFVLFFIIGLTIFLGIGEFFRYQSDIFKYDASLESVKLINSYFSSLALTSYDSCKQCNYVNITVKTANTTAGNYFYVNFGSFGENVSIPFTSINSITPLHNFLPSVNATGLVASIKPITLTFNKTQNQITIS